MTFININDPSFILKPIIYKRLKDLESLNIILFNKQQITFTQIGESLKLALKNGDLNKKIAALAITQPKVLKVYNALSSNPKLKANQLPTIMPDLFLLTYTNGTKLVRGVALHSWAKFILKEL